MEGTQIPRPRGGYRNKAGEQVPGCTTIINRFKESGGLVNWAFEVGRSGADSLYEQTNQAADIGTYAHALFEAERRHQKPPPAPPGMTKEQVSRAETAYLSALNWARDFHVETIAVEVPLVCECHGYGATLDEVARVGGKGRNIEWKTSNAFYLDHLLQAAAQKHVWECTHPKEPPLEGSIIIRWSKEYGDFAHHSFDDLTEPFKQFVRFCDAYKADRVLRRRIG